MVLVDFYSFKQEMDYSLNLLIIYSQKNQSKDNPITSVKKNLFNDDFKKRLENNKRQKTKKFDINEVMNDSDDEKKSEPESELVDTPESKQQLSTPKYYALRKSNSITLRSQKTINMTPDKLPTGSQTRATSRKQPRLQQSYITSKTKAKKSSSVKKSSRKISGK